MDLASTLTKRREQYGDFADVARVSQNIKLAMADSRNWSSLDPDQREALAMLANKLGRLLNGNSNHLDGWADASAYLLLVADRLHAQPNTLKVEHDHAA